MIIHTKYMWPVLHEAGRQYCLITNSLSGEELYMYVFLVSAELDGCKIE